MTEPIDDALADEAAELIQETNARYEERRREQREFLDTVSEEEGEEVLETKCNIVGEYVVPLRAKLNGEIIDKLGNMQARIQRLDEADPEDARVHDYGDAADEAAQILDDVIDDPDYNKQLFYDAYRDEGLLPLGTMLERCFESLQEERERMEGIADGFRKDTGGT